MAADTIPAGELSGDPRRHRRERRYRRAFLVAASLSVVISALIVTSLVGEATRFITSVDLGSLWSSGWFPRNLRFDIKTLLVASLIISGIALAVAAPLGLGAAIYLSEYARPRARRAVKPIVEILAGVPSVVLGFFALAFISPNLVQLVFPSAGQFNMLAAGIGTGILVTPLMASVSEDALRSVPQELREASFALGARKRWTITRVVLPASVSGIVAAAILSVSRAIGETMVVTIAAGGSGSAPFQADPLEEGVTMTSAIANLALGSDMPAIGDPFISLFFVGMLLFVFTLLLNVVGDRIVRRYRKAY